MSMHLMGLDKQTHLTDTLIYFVVYLLSTSEAYILKRLPCYKDLCERGRQYCVKEKERCYHCKDVIQNCGSDEMPLECDAFCRDVKATERERALNKTFEVYRNEYVLGKQQANITADDLYNDGYEVATYILTGLLVFVIAGFVIYILVLHRRALKDIHHTEKDVENEPFIAHDDDSHEQKRDELGNQDNKTDDENVDEDEIDVSLQDQTKRDSGVSSDSAVDSFNSSDDVRNDEGEDRNDESARKTDIGRGPRKDCGPTIKKPATGSKEITRVMNPTNGENANTSELAVNSEMSPLHKLIVSPVAQPVS